MAVGRSPEIGTPSNDCAEITDNENNRTMLRMSFFMIMFFNLF
jgi:hypothetical protein